MSDAGYVWQVKSGDWIAVYWPNGRSEPSVSLGTYGTQADAEAALRKKPHRKPYNPAGECQ